MNNLIKEIKLSGLGTVAIHLVICDFQNLLKIAIRQL